MGTNVEKFYTLTEDISPAVPVHPGEILGEELKARGISQKVFAEKAGMQATHLSAIIHGVRNITPAVSQKLESALEGISADSWIRLQEHYNRDSKRRKIKLSHLVSGYGESMPAPATMLSESDPLPYAARYTAYVTIPEKDRAILDLLSERLGWKIDYSK